MHYLCPDSFALPANVCFNSFYIKEASTYLPCYRIPLNEWYKLQGSYSFYYRELKFCASLQEDYRESIDFSDKYDLWIENEPLKGKIK